MSVVKEPLRVGIEPSEAWIQDHDFSHVSEGPIDVETYQKFYEQMEQEMSRPTVYYDLLLTDQDLANLTDEQQINL